MSDLYLYGKPVYTDPTLDNDPEYYEVHSDILYALNRGFQCIQDMPDCIAGIADLYKQKQHRSWMARLIFGE